MVTLLLGEDDQYLREDLGEAHEQPIRDEETTKAGGETLCQGKAHRPRPRAAKVVGWQMLELLVPTALKI